MSNYRQSTIEFAAFTFERKKVVCYGLQNNAGGTTTIMNFATMGTAGEFREAFLRNRNFHMIQNDAQLVCLTDYDRVMRKSEDDPRVRFLYFSRDFMMGTIAHIM